MWCIFEQFVSLSVFVRCFPSSPAEASQRGKGNQLGEYLRAPRILRGKRICPSSSAEPAPVDNVVVVVELGP